jgi:Carbohydrate family 9 binding domain-like
MRRAVVVLCALVVLGVAGLLVLLPKQTPAEAKAAFPPPPGYVCLRTAKHPNIDGKLDDDCWALAPWSGDFVDIEGDRKPKPAHRTRMKMLWDDDGLYVAAELTEPHVWATITKRDAVIFHDNDFEVFFAPDDDTHLYAEVELNAFNTLWDLLLTKPYYDGGQAIQDWNIPGFQSAVQVQGTLNNPSDTDTGWTVEIFWPWPNLKELNTHLVPPKLGSIYRMNMSRVNWDTNIVDGKYVKKSTKDEHNWVWAPTGVIDIHRPHRWGYVLFTDDAKATSPVDPAWATIDELYDLRGRQKGHHKKHGKYAESFAELGVLERPSGATMQSWPYGVAVSNSFGGRTYTVLPEGNLQVR